MHGGTTGGAGTRARATGAASPKARGSPWERLFALHEKQIAERERLAEEAAEVRRRREAEEDRARTSRHQRAPVTDEEARAFFEAQRRWRRQSDEASRQAWLEQRRAEYAEYRDPVLSPRSRAMAEATTHGSLLKDWDARLARWQEARRGGGGGSRTALAIAPVGEASLQHSDTPQSERRRTLSASALKASVERQHDEELERRRRHLKALVEDLEWEATDGGRQAGTPMFHPSTTPHRSTSKGRRRTGKEAGTALHEGASGRQARLEAARLAARRREDAENVFAPQLCALSAEMALPRRRPLYSSPDKRSGGEADSGQGANARGQGGGPTTPQPPRCLSAMELGIFMARNERLVQQRAASVRAHRTAAVKAELDSCTFRPKLSARTRELAAAKEVGWQAAATESARRRMPPSPPRGGPSQSRLLDASGIRGATTESSPSPRSAPHAARSLCTSPRSARQQQQVGWPTTPCLPTPLLTPSRLGRTPEAGLPYRSFSHEERAQVRSPAKDRTPELAAHRSPDHLSTVERKRRFASPPRGGGEEDEDEVHPEATRRVLDEAAAFQREMHGILAELSGLP